MVCWGDGDIPAFLELGDGNQSDKKEFAGLLKKFKEQWQFEGLHIADSALYSSDNLQQLSGINWLCSVPKTIREVQEVVTELTSEQFVSTDLEGYRLSPVEREYAGVKQRWLIVESEQKKALDLKQLNKKVEKATAQAHQQLQQLSRQEFACREDALTALKQWQKSLDWHKLEDQQVVEKCHYGHRGKPRLQEQPTRRSYHVQATFGLKQSKVPTAQRQAGRFVLATNQLGTCVGIIFQPENRSVEEPDQPDGTLSKRKSLRATSTETSPRRARGDSAESVGKADSASDIGLDFSMFEGDEVGC